MNPMVIPDGWFAGITGFVTAVVLLPVVRGLALRLHLYDSPGPLKIHTKPVPRVGGIALASALVIGITMSGFGASPPATSFYLPLAVILITGLLDDLYGVSPGIRLVAQTWAAFLLWQAGLGGSLFGSALLDYLMTCLLVVAFVNAFNFLDGTDGLAAGVTCMVALGYVLVHGKASLSFGSVIAWSLLGSCLGFLLFNFSPAKIFMGDSGSTMLGFVVAFLGLDFYRGNNGLGPHLLLPLIFAGLPLLDFVLAILRRLRKGVSPFAGDRRHFYDLLLQRGWSARQVAFCSYGVTGVLLITGKLSIRGNWTVSGSVLLLVVGYLLITAIKLGSLCCDSVLSEMQDKTSTKCPRVA